MSPLPAAPSRRVPLPTCDDLMRAVADGQPACDVWSARFAEWSVPVAVPHIVMNALDPLLIETVLGPAESRRWLPVLREHYGRVKDSYPGEFANVEASWTDQRAWWMQFVEGADGAEDASSGGGGGPGPPEPVPPGHAVVARSRQPAAPPAPAPAPAAESRPASPLGGAARATAAAGAPHLPMEAPAEEAAVTCRSSRAGAGAGAAGGPVAGRSAAAPTRLAGTARRSGFLPGRRCSGRAGRAGHGRLAPGAGQSRRARPAAPRRGLRLLRGRASVVRTLGPLRRGSGGVGGVVATLQARPGRRLSGGSSMRVCRRSCRSSPSTACTSSPPWA